VSQDVVSAELQETPDPERPAEDVAVSMDLAMSAATAEAEPGERLKAARLGMGMSVSDVARQLKLRPRQVEALERGDHQALPGPVFVRGFARNYARLVGLDADTLAGAAARPEIPGSGAAEAGKGRAAVWTSGTQGPVFEEGAARARKSWWPVTVGLIIVAAVLLYLGRERLYPDTPGEAATVPAGDVMGEQTQGGASGADAGETTTGTPVDLAIAPPPVPAPARADVAPPGAGPSASGAIANPVPAPQGEDGVGRPPFPESAPAASTSGTALASRPGEVVTGAGPVLRLAFTQDSWVEVRDGSGAVVFSQMGPAGSERVVRGQPPLRLTVGNSSGVRVNFRSRDVDLAPHTQSEVAHVTLE
jgi:cytoskeleton protein RodZ